MIDVSPILVPVLVLVLWSHVVLIWMAAARLPAIQKAGLGPTAGERTIELGAQLDKKVQWKADNYNHLMEHPTVFYATVFALALAGLGDGVNLLLAWFYVACRIVHSLVHCTVNTVMLRFAIFALSMLAVIAMAVNGLLALAHL